ncbi:MAG: nitroreductase family protein [Candidatus Nanohaloarchaea archaeon]
MAVLETVLNLTSFRDADDKVIPRRKVGKILEAGRNTPSPGNVQALEFIVVEDQHKKEVISKVTDDKRFSDAPTSIVILGDIQRMKRRVGEKHSEQFANAEAAAAAQNMRLVAQEEELSSIWVTGFDQDFLGEQLSVPTGKEPLAVVGLAYTQKPQSQSVKFGMNEVCFYDRYGNQVDSVFDGVHWKGLRENSEIYGKKYRGLKEKLAEKLRKHL